MQAWFEEERLENPRGQNLKTARSSGGQNYLRCNLHGFVKSGQVMALTLFSFAEMVKSLSMN